MALRHTHCIEISYGSVNFDFNIEVVLYLKNAIFNEKLLFSPKSLGKVGIHEGHGPLKGRRNKFSPSEIFTFFLEKKKRNI